MQVREVLEWLSSLSPGDMVAVDEGGLALVLVGDDNVYCEVGGIPVCDLCGFDHPEEEPCPRFAP